ncbi:ATP-binding cassette domain-containing protein [Paenibacillus prosopidis]|uniref:ABC-2 type transport system ATP-binding protein n=1 Tax=Paenibacillus prosopidis TaxID=630520 RepID=A0A368VZH2_9BACL|nr:ABC transporter ATP-binding protein [Paenibacillus prosopidis]RCW47415.1 ABC-2 type transport system ATP-binding protein [Paenibacillus prosopidis]
MIEVKDIRKRYRRRDVLNGVSFTAAKGEITCLIGVNGAGKSTILKAIMGLTPISGGSIHIDEQSLRPQLYEKIAFVPDHLTMPSGMKLSEAIKFMADFYDSWNNARARELMQFFRLNYSDKIGSLSKGTAAKFNLLLGLGQDSDYLLMDEPFSGIDLFSREAIANVFTSDLIEGRGVLLTTHEIGELEHLIDKAVLLQDGKVSRAFNCEEMRYEEGKSVIDVMREVYRA